MNHPLIDNVLASLSMPTHVYQEQEAAQELLEPYTYVSSSPGKGFRNQLIQALNHWLRVPSVQLKAIVQTIELLHNASLLVDDIEDDSALRRGKPVAHKIYGVAQTINSANYVYFLAYQQVMKIPGMIRVQWPHIHNLCLPYWNISNSVNRVVRILNDEMLALHCGQGRELFWRDHLRCPTEGEYIQMVKEKTGGLLRIAIRLMVECSTVNTASDIHYVPLVELLGIWFQIRDDYMNLHSDTYTEQKGFAEDLEEGKFSFPIIHGIRESPNQTYIINILRQRTKDTTLKRHTISYLKEVTHSFEYTLSALRSLESQARAEVTRLGGNPTLEAIINTLAVV
ncbi:isoprenoid synthase domain-containing protein [Chiua virens]|nr:isoprenoid synthase domain-containing protein [Chiua virens]